MSVVGTDPVLVSTYTGRARGGYVTVRRWEGSADGVNTVIAGLERWEDYDIDPRDDPRFVLTVRTPDTVDGSDEVQYNWEIVGEDNTKDLWEHPALVAATQTEDGIEQMELVKQAIDDKSGRPALSGTGDTVFDMAYDLLSHGATSWRWPTYRLRFSGVVACNWNGGVIDDGANRIYTASDIASEFSLFPMFDRTAARVAALQAAEPHNVFGSDPVYDAGFTWGWLKSPTTETESGRWKIRLETEWVLDWWHSGLLYRTK
jgi:hypothetical protein